MDDASLKHARMGFVVVASGTARLIGILSNIIIMVLATIAIAAVGGFYLFYKDVSGLTPPANPRADAIIVLTGGYQRIDQAVNLLASGAGRRLLISGVNPATTMAQIRNFTKSPPDLFDCCVDIGYQALDTSGNAQEAADWIAARNFKTVIVVTNNYHMPRSLLELKRIDKQTVFIAYPVGNTRLGLSDIVANPYLILTLGSEYLKMLFAASRDWLTIFS